MEALLMKGLVAFPTDTVFGLACIADEEAMRKVYEVKGRDSAKALPMMCSSLSMIRDYAVVDRNAEKIIEHFTPGPLTLVMKRREDVDPFVTQGLDTIGIRIPDDEWILSLIADLGRPLMVTSANVSGEGSLISWEDVYDCLKGRIDMIVCEDARGERASTIIDVHDGLKVLREGPLNIEDIREVLNEEASDLCNRS